MPGARRFTRSVRVLVLGLSLVAASLTFAVLWSVGLGWFLVLTAGGGALAASAMRPMGRRQRPGPVTVDAFARDTTGTDTINVARVRVAGVGGIGMLLVALAIALDLAFVGVVLAAGLAGGLLAAVAIILWRRRTGPLQSSPTGPGGARGVLFSETTDPPSAPSADTSDRQQRRTVAASTI
jgi:hypothetical protein